ncbi:MAG: hypothetical protein JNN08_22135 [Bryobacterales bacterium]|nr:hypothetical protein [Bryobacterales bacterium]
MIPTLVNAAISFHTNDEDKDDDTHVTVRVTDENNVIAAEIDNDFGHFDDNSDSGPFPMVVLNPSTQKALQRGSWIIRIDPNGNDTWRFNATLVLTFSNQNRFTVQMNGIQLTQNRQQQQFGLQGFIPDPPPEPKPLGTVIRSNVGTAN